MTKELSLILLQKINDAPYLDRKSGLVQTFDKVMEMTDAGPITKKIPVTAFATLAQCQNHLYTHMIPDSKYKGMVYFEDGGTTTENIAAGVSYTSRIRLVCWLNTKLIYGQENMLLTSVMVNDLIKRLTRDQFGNMIVPNFIVSDGGIVLTTDDGLLLLTDDGNVRSNFTKINIKIANIIQDRSIFSKYDYSEKETQYLMSPFEYFALDLVVKYNVRLSCMVTLEDNFITN